MIIPVNMNIRHYRQMKMMTQDELAKAIGVTASVVQRYESGLIAVPLERLTQISEVLDVSPALLMGYGDQVEEIEKLVDAYDKLNEENKKTVNNLVQALLVAQIANSK